MTEQQQYEQQQQQPAKQQPDPPRRSPYATRARGSSGIPPPTLDLNDLEGMNEEELMQALYNDPELAELAAEAGRAKKATGGSTSSSSRKAKAKAGITKDGYYPSHIQEKMQEGIPVVQWIIILLLLGAGLYQLKKTLELPDKKKTIPGGGISSIAGAKKGIAGTGTGKANKGNKGATVANKQKAKPKKAAETKPSFASITKAAKAPPDEKSNKTSKKKAKQKSKAADKVETSSAEEQAAESATTTSSTSTPAKKSKKKKHQQDNGGAQSSSKSNGDANTDAKPDTTNSNAKANTDNTTPVNQIIDDDDDGGDGWQAVGQKPSKPTVATNNSNRTNANANTGIPENGGDTKAASVSAAAAITNSEDTAGFQPAASTKKKPRKTATPGDTDANVDKTDSGAASSMDTDEALAMQLQREEDRARTDDQSAESQPQSTAQLATLSQEQDDDEWAEVSTKKKRKP
jgi:hypothetical protein